MRGIKLGLVVLLVTSPAIADRVAVKKLDKGGTYDCGQPGNSYVSINNGKGTYVFKGQCNSILVGGGMNTLTIESVHHLDVGGARNTITIDTVTTIDVGGSGNTITYKQAKGGGKPTIKGQPAKNTITQSK